MRVNISEVTRCVKEKGREVDHSTIRLMCRVGILKPYAEKIGNSWFLPTAVADDFIENWRPYSRWAPKQTQRAGKRT